MFSFLSYCKEPSKGAKRAQVNAILEDLIELTIAEKGVCIKLHVLQQKCPVLAKIACFCIA